MEQVMPLKNNQNRRHLRAVSLLALAAAALVPHSALAAPDEAAVEPAAATAATAPSRVQTFEAAWFTQFSPTTALDMVRRVPGFALEESEEEVRGFSQAAGNVVMNGARPSSKSEGLAQLLARIPASRVLRIELGSGEVFGSDYAAKSQVVNLVLSEAGGIDGNVKASAQRLHTGWLVPNLEGSVLIRTGGSTINLSASSGRSGQVEVGFDDLTRLSDGSRLEYREKQNTIHDRRPTFAASWGQEGSGGRAAHLNLRYSPRHFNLKQVNHVTPASGPERDDRLEQDFHPTTYELGGDLARPLGSGVLKFVALANRRDSNAHDTSLNRVNGQTVGGFELLLDSRYDEVLGRLSWATPQLAGFAVELGSEVAYNRLENATELYALGAGGARSRIDLPIDQAVVDELRTESYLSLGRQLTRSLRLETRLAFETSNLEVSGDTQARRNLSYFKPGLTLDWKGPKSWHVQLAARRTVAQLDFFDFLANAELANDRINGGNADLVPQRTWEFRATIDRPLLGKGAVKLELGHDRVSQLQDRILTPEGFDAPGNIGSGTRSFAQLTLDAPLDSLGLKSFRGRLTGLVQDHSVRDPLTGQDRPWSGFRPRWSVNAELRRDLSQVSYGVELFRQATSTVYRIDELDSFFNSGPFVVAFVEYRPDKKTTLRLDVENLGDVAGQRRRLFFDPNRTAPAPVIEEFRHRDAHVGLTVSVNRTL
jgi:hypothetical protein